MLLSIRGPKVATWYGVRQDNIRTRLSREIPGLKNQASVLGQANGDRMQPESKILHCRVPYFVKQRSGLS